MMSLHTSGTESGVADTSGPLDKVPTPTKKKSLAELFSRKEAIKCRHCGSANVRPSHKAHSSSQYVVYRCRDCKHHFKVVSEQPRRLTFVSVGLFALVALGVAAAVFTGNETDVVYQPPLDMQDHHALAKTEAAAKRGDAQAQYELGWAYWQRDDYLQALPLLKAAAAQGQVDAEYLLGMAYLNGRGTVQDYRAALEQFTKAAHGGNMEAQYRLGIFYRDGLATPANKETAYLWLNLAAARGHTDAIAMRDRLTMLMSGEEIIRAQEASAQMQKQLNETKPGTPQQP